MKISTPIIAIVFLALAAGNLWQWYNPKVVELPAGQEQIDEGTWVQRAAYVSRGLLLDSLRAENEEMARRIRDSRDQIANLTTMTGRLHLQIDSLETVSRLPLQFENLQASGRSLKRSDLEDGQRLKEPERLRYTSRFPADTSYNFISVFGAGLFRVDSEVRFHRDYLENNLELQQLRDIRLTVANTINPDQTRLLTYVTSPDFETLNYQTYTELPPRRRTPWLLAGVAIGAGAVLILN